MISLSLPLQASNVPPTSSRPFSRVFARAPFPHLFLDPIPIRFLDHTSENTLREFTATWKQSSLRYWELRVYRYLSIKLECLVKLPEIDGHRTRKMRIKWQDIKDISRMERQKLFGISIGFSFSFKYKARSAENKDISKTHTTQLLGTGLSFV